MPRVLFFSRCSYTNGLCSVTVGVAGSFCSTHVSWETSSDRTFQQSSEVE
jgi:hypothetical protein